MAEHKNAGETMLRTDRTQDVSVLAVASTVPISGRYDGEMSLPQPAEFADEVAKVKNNV
jgi:hypothetical protein